MYPVWMTTIITLVEHLPVFFPSTLPNHALIRKFGGTVRTQVELWR
jgi:hypothetical protein